MKNYKLFFFTILFVVTFLDCSNRSFIESQVLNIDKCQASCSDFLSINFPYLKDRIKFRNSEFLLEYSDLISISMDEEYLHYKNARPKLYEYKFKMINENWINFDFHLLSDLDCNCQVHSSNYTQVKEKLEIYSEILQNEKKVEFIKSFGNLKFDGKFNLVVFSEKDVLEVTTINENGISLDDFLFDQKHGKYGFLVISAPSNESNDIMTNSGYVINLDRLEVLNELKPAIDFLDDKK